MDDPIKKAPKKKSKILERYKKEQIARFVTSFFVTATVAVGAGVIATRTEPTVKFENVAVVGKKVYYQTSVIDPDSTINPSTLSLDVKSGLEIENFPLELGVTRGSFPLRYYDLDYNLSIKGSQGFGKKTFATYTFKIKPGPSADFISIDYTSLDGQGYLFSVEVGTDSIDLFNDSLLFSLESYNTTEEIEPIKVDEYSIYVTEERQIFNELYVSDFANKVNLRLELEKGEIELILASREIELPIYEHEPHEAYAYISNLTYTRPEGPGEPGRPVEPGEGNGFIFSFDVEIIDPNHTVRNTKVLASFEMEGQDPPPPHPAWHQAKLNDTISLGEFIIEGDFAHITLPEVPMPALRVHLKVVGEDSNGNRVSLATLDFGVPRPLGSMLQLLEFNSDSLEFTFDVSAIGLLPPLDHAEVRLYKGETLIETRNVPLPSETGQEWVVIENVTFTGLESETLYNVEADIHYIDPFTNSPAVLEADPTSAYTMPPLLVDAWATQNGPMTYCYILGPYPYDIVQSAYVTVWGYDNNTPVFLNTVYMDLNIIQEDPPVSEYTCLVENDGYEHSVHHIDFYVFINYMNQYKVHKIYTYEVDYSLP